MLENKTLSTISLEILTLVKEKTRVVFMIGERPPQAPGSFFVFNAPRPLHGTELPFPDRENINYKILYGDANSYTWYGDWVQGRHWAAIDPANDYALHHAQHNCSMDASLIFFVDRDTYNQETIEWAKKYLIEFNKHPKHNATLDQLSLRQWDETRRNNSEIKIFGEWLEGEINS